MSLTSNYLIVGCLNTVFGYAVGVLTYKFLAGCSSVWIIGLVSNVITITFSFVMYKLFVFKTSGQWLLEYIKAYLVYGAMALLSIFLLWFYVASLKISIWIAQALIIATTVVASYFGHSKITFSRKKQ